MYLEHISPAHPLQLLLNAPYIHLQDSYLLFSITHGVQRVLPICARVQGIIHQSTGTLLWDTQLRKTDSSFPIAH